MYCCSQQEYGSCSHNGSSPWLVFIWCEIMEQKEAYKAVKSNPPPPLSAGTKVKVDPIVRFSFEGLQALERSLPLLELTVLFSY